MAKVGQRGRLVLDKKTSTGAGFKGKVTKVEGGMVYLQLDGEGKFGPRTVKGSLSRFRAEDTNSEGDTMNEAIKPKSKEDEGEYGYEGDMAMSQLRSIIRNSQAMLDNLEPETDLPEWVQSKITLAKDYIETSANYLMSELEEEVKPVDEGLLSGTLKVAGKVFNAPAYSWAGEKLEKREKAKKLAAERAARKARRTTKKAQTKEVSESAEQNDRVKKVMDKYRGIRNKVNTKPELEVSIRNTSPNIMGNIPGHEGPKPNANF